MPRLTILAKGNGDLRDTLVALHENGAVAWNGINVVLREKHPRFVARVLHRTMSRTDAVLESDGTAPDVGGRRFPADPFTPASQYSRDLFSTPAEVVILSIQADVMNTLARHRRDGYLLFPYNARQWPSADLDWLAEKFIPVPLLEPDESMGSFKRIISRLRKRGPIRILIFNLSPIVPWEHIHCYRGMPETLSCRIRRFNIALTELSRETGISVVDVDSILARAGASLLKHDALTLTAEGCALVAQEVVRILGDLGSLTDDGTPV